MEREKYTLTDKSKTRLDLVMMNELLNCPGTQKVRRLGLSEK